MDRIIIGWVEKIEMLNGGLGNMAYSKSINIFLPTGSSDGPIELETLNWNGMVIKVPRKEVDTYR